MKLSIQEISKKIGMSSHTLRYYEKEEIIPKIKRNSSGHREYDKEDIEWINFVTCLKSTGMNISSIKEFIDLSKLGDDSISQRKKMLMAHREHILERMSQMNEYLERISWKIDYYDGLEKKTAQKNN